MALPARHSVTAGSGWGMGSRIIGMVAERMGTEAVGVGRCCVAGGEIVYARAP